MFVFVMIRWLIIIRSYGKLDYFQDVLKVKYQLCSKLVCALTIYDMIISIIFQIKVFDGTQFYTDSSSQKYDIDSILILFVFSFSSIHFSLWIIDQLGDWIESVSTIANFHRCNDSASKPEISGGKMSLLSEQNVKQLEEQEKKEDTANSNDCVLLHGDEEAIKSTDAQPTPWRWAKNKRVD